MKYLQSDTEEQILKATYVLFASKTENCQGVQITEVNDPYNGCSGTKGRL